MIDGTLTIEPRKTDTTLPDQRTSLWSRLALGVIMLISIFMNFYQLGQNGFGNTYYASAIRSMLDNWHNFFFVSFDPGGYITIDKPPLGFWLQVASAKLFGFTAFSIFFPQALAGVLSVLLLYWLVRRHFGVVAGLLAALALAFSPISVVTNRNNTIDSTLILVILLAVWTTMRAAETGKLRWLLLTGVLIGLGFNIKMMEAYLVVPALVLVYLLSSPKKLRVRVTHLLLAGLLMLTISLSWATVVDLTPASQRPYVGSTQNNSELSLAIGYNGIERLIGGVLPTFGGGSKGSARPSGAPPAGFEFGTSPTQGQGGNGQFPGAGAGGQQGLPGGAIGGGAGASGGMFGTGSPGIFRLFGSSLGGQIAWLLPFALLALLALAWQSRLNPRENRQQQSLVLWGVWLLTNVVFYSAASFFHQYYLSTVAPEICALFGIGIVVMWRDYRRVGWRGWLLPLALVLTAAEQMYIISTNAAWGSWLIPVIAGLTVVTVLALVIGRLAPRIVFNKHLLTSAVCVGILALLLTPAIWTAIPTLKNYTFDLPTAGPTTGQTPLANGRSTTGSNTADATLIAYLQANQGEAKYLLATLDAQTAAPIILATNKPVMAIGGFMGSDPSITLSELKSLVSQGTIRFFLLNTRQGPQSARSVSTSTTGNASGVSNASNASGSTQSSISNWVQTSCKVVSSSVWQSSTSSTSISGFGGFQGNEQLYDCSVTK